MQGPLVLSSSTMVYSIRARVPIVTISVSLTILNVVPLSLLCISCSISPYSYSGELAFHVGIDSVRP